MAVAAFGDMLNHIAHLDVLREDESTLVLLIHGIEELNQLLHFARAVENMSRRLFLQVKGRVVANLLQFGEHLQDQPLALKTT